MARLNRTYLRGTQYCNASNLNARIALHERFSTNREDEHRWIFNQLDLPPDATILELGCGPGTLWQKNLDRLPTGWRIMLTDFSPGMLVEARQSLAGRGHPFQFLVVDAQQIPFANMTFDAVIANYMLYHLTDLPSSLAGIRRVLKPGGQFYAATNGHAHMQELMAMAEWLGERPAAESRVESPRFLLEQGQGQLAPFFSDIELRHRENGLAVTEVEPIIAYLLSTKNAHDRLDALGPDEAERRIMALRGDLARQLARDGVIQITKDSGLFVARRGPARQGYRSRGDGCV